MHLTLRFFVLVGALLAAVAASAGAGYRALNTLDAALVRVVDTDMQRMLAITHARRVFRSMTVLERDFILARSPSERDGMREKMKKLGDELTQHLDRYESLMDAADEPQVARIRGVRERWLERDSAVLTAAVADTDRALSLAKLHKQDPVSWETEIGDLVKLSETRLSEQVARVHDQAGVARTTLGLVSSLAALVALGLGSLIFFAIRRNVAEVVHLNANLEGLVAERTAALHERERSLTLVLDSTGDGFIVVDLAGAIQGECSRAAVRWFGVPRAGMHVAEYLRPDDPSARLELEVAFAQLADDFLPWELSLEQFPKRLSHGDHTLELEIKRVLEDGRFSRMLVIARDISERVRGEDAERSAREQQAIIGKLLADKTGFAQFVGDTEQLIDDLLAETDPVNLRRFLHTLKGNVALFGMQSLADNCHALEDKLAASEGRPAADDLHRLQRTWRSRLAGIDGFLNAARAGVFEVKTEEHQHLVRSILERRDYEELLAMVETWTWARAADMLGRIRSQLEFLAKKLGKPARVHVHDNGVRLPSGYLEKLWPTLVHVSRNTIDHGIEPESERIGRGKPAEANITLTTRLTDGEFVLEIGDDGPGIDCAKLEQRARERGIPRAAGDPPELLIFADGLSSRDAVTELSGRGVGLSATRDACEQEGGRIEVVSVLGRGTTLRFLFPRPRPKHGGAHPESGRLWTLSPARAV